MNIIEAAKYEVVEGIDRDYRVGFVNEENPDGDEVELTATGMDDLKDVWESLCQEFDAEPDSVTYVEAVPFDQWRIEAEFEDGTKEVFAGISKEKCLRDIADVEKRLSKCVRYIGVENEFYSDGKYIGPY